MRPSPAGASRCSARICRCLCAAEDAKALGLAFVHQNLALIPTLSLTENFRLSRLSNGARLEHLLAARA